MKVYINREPIHGPYGGGNMFVTAFHKRAPHLCELMLDQTLSITPDVILLAGLDNDGVGISLDQAVMYQMYVKPDVKIVLRVNENDARKGTKHVDPLLLKASEYITGTVFVSEWLHNYFVEKGWACKHNTVIVNGVAPDIFAPQPKLNNGKLNLVAHHWSDNPMKGADIYEKIDQLVGEHPDKFAFTYVGRTQSDFKHTKVIKPIFGRALGEELGKHDAYISASRFDPGPNHVLEALSCGLPTYVHVDGGGCVDFAGADHAYYSWDQLKNLLLENAAHGYMTRPNTKAVQLRPWMPVIQDYIAFLEQTLKV